MGAVNEVRHTMAELKMPAATAESGPPRSNSGWTRLLGFRSSLCFWQHGVIFFIACLILISRRPDAVFHAQFYAEDGHTWFADEYTYGWWSGLWRNYEGYHHVFMRLGAALALLVPLALAPLVMNLIAIGLQALVVNLLLSMRSSAWGSLGFRAILAAVFLALPNTLEMLNNISQDQWPLTLCAFLLLVAKPPKSLPGKVFDLSICCCAGSPGRSVFFCCPLRFSWPGRTGIAGHWWQPEFLLSLVRFRGGVCCTAGLPAGRMAYSAQIRKCSYASSPVRSSSGLCWALTLWP